MQREATCVVRRGLAFVLLLIAPAMALTDSKSAAPFELDAIVLKENGRLHEEIVAECTIEEKLREAATTLSKKLRRKQSRRASSETVEPRHVTLRIDKVGNLGSMGQAGTELGVTAILAGKDAGPLFLCRDSGLFSRPTHCDRISHCSRQIADDVAHWVGAQNRSTQ